MTLQENSTNEALCPERVRQSHVNANCDLTKEDHYGGGDYCGAGPLKGKEITPPRSCSLPQSLLSMWLASLCTDDTRASYSKHGTPLGELISQVMRYPVDPKVSQF